MTQVKLIIAGGRDFTDYVLLRKSFLEFVGRNQSKNVTIISGMARGADLLALAIADEFKLKVIEMPADWNPNGVYNRGAGYKRNVDMSREATHLLAMHDGKSKGTGHMIDIARKAELHVKVVAYVPPPPKKWRDKPVKGIIKRMVE